MAISEHLSTFAGYPVREFEPARVLDDPAHTVYRIIDRTRFDRSHGEDSLGCAAMLLAGASGAAVQVWKHKLWLTLVSALAALVAVLVVGSKITRKLARTCPGCGKPLQTRDAPFCAACGKDFDPSEALAALRSDAGLRPLVDQGPAAKLLAQLVAAPAASELPGLILCDCEAWTSNRKSLAGHLASLAERLPGRRALFVGELIQEECEISWIDHGDLSALIAAFPRLEHLQVRGSATFGKLRHACLKKLVIESGGLDGDIIREIAAAELPQLADLELWLGTPMSGGDATVDDLRPILSGECFPRLDRLALRNSEITDEIVAALVDSPLFDRIRVLDLSLGTLSDVGAELLLAAERTWRLEKLDIHHHFVSPPLVERLRSLGIEFDAGEPLAGDPAQVSKPAQRYCAVME
jgi:hypothetical protein